jgi:hypothetical protein
MKKAIVFTLKDLPRPIGMFIVTHVVWPILFSYWRFLVVSVVISVAISEGNQEDLNQLFRDAWNISEKCSDIVEPIMQLRRWSGASGGEVDAQDLQVLESLRETIHCAQSLSTEEKEQICNYLASPIRKIWQNSIGT